jgi:hypothetical protein
VSEDDDWDDQRLRTVAREVGWPRALAWWLKSTWWQVSYAVRPYDMLADQRRWFWTPPVHCRCGERHG